MTSVSREIAEAEVNAWLEKKKVFSSTKESSKDSIEVLVDAMCNGVLSLDQQTWNFTHKLLFPFGDQVKVEELKYKPRLNDKMLKPYLNGVKASDAEGRLLAYIAALTGQSRAILEELDTADKKIAMAIAIFFL